MKLKQILTFVLYTLLTIGFSSVRADAYVDFFRAIERDDAGSISSLLARGLDPNIRNPKGQVGLYVALRDNSPAAAEALWKHPQLQIDVRNDAQETPLMMAALRGDLVWMTRLMDRGAPAQHAGWSPIHYAATGPKAEAVALMLDRGASLEARSPNGTTPLMMAARYGPEASVDLLLQRGADRSLRSDQGMTPADFAASAGREKLAARLR